MIQPDISHIGGLLETKKLASWADAYYVTIAPQRRRPDQHRRRTPPGRLHHELPHPGVLQRLRDPWVRESPNLSEVTDGYFELPKVQASASSLTRKSSKPTPSRTSTSTSSPRAGRGARARGTGANQ